MYSNQKWHWSTGKKENLDYIIYIEWVFVFLLTSHSNEQLILISSFFLYLNQIDWSISNGHRHTSHGHDNDSMSTEPSWILVMILTLAGQSQRLSQTCTWKFSGVFSGIQIYDLCNAGATLLPTELWIESHSDVSRSICWAHVFPWKECMYAGSFRTSIHTYKS